jgi:hypothetical protein
VDGLCAGLVGFIVALTSRGHRRVGDMAAKTFVVGGQYMGYPVAVPGMTTNYTAYPGYPGYPGDRPPTEPPQTWAPPPTWGPAPTWAPPPETAPPQATPPPQATADESPTGASAESGDAAGASAAPQHPVETAPAPEPAPTGPAPAAGAPAEDVAVTGQPSAEAGSTAEAATPDYNPQWDPARGTYIVWSAERGHWLGWDDVAKEWKPL